MGNAIKFQRYTQQGDDLKTWSEVEACAEAVKLYSLCNSPHPIGNYELTKVVLKDVLNTAFRFAVHARRVLEIEEDVHSEVALTAIESKLSTNYGDSFNFQRKLRTAVSKIIHARKIAILTNQGKSRDNGILTFEDSDMIVALEIKSDRGEEFHVCPQGVAWGFLLRGQEKL